jgi:hypothetical protein
MATVTKGRTFTSGETVTPAKLNDVVDLATVTNIVDADIGNGAAIAASKLAGTLDLSSKTVTLPDDSVTNAKLSLAANDGEIKKAINADNAAPIYACRAWVNFDATRDASGASNTSNTNRFLRGNGNVASVLKTADGQFTVTFTTAMPSANYAAVASGVHAPLASRGTNYETFDLAAASFSMTTGYASPTTNGTFFNPTVAHVAVFA